MSQKELALLEKAFAAEIDAAINKTPRVMQTRSKLAAKLVADGLLREASEVFGHGPFAVRLAWYELTELGRLAYCTSC